MILSTITSRVDELDKAAFDDFCASAAINMCVKVVVHDRKPSFEAKQVDPFFRATNQSHLMKPIQQLNGGKGNTHELVEDDE